ncbi:MAG: exodeoxyribonuclease VII large subunit [Patescibacteria group bacterium]
MTEQPAISVSQFLGLVNQTLRALPTDTFAIEGEVADFRVSQGKWINFDLKDEEVEVKVPCFMTTFQLGTALESGMRVRVTGYPKVFERFGKFSLNVESVIPVGEGALAKAYALLKAKLTQEGIFDQARKRTLPKFPSRVGLITSKEAAAYGDFLRILANRMGGVTILHANVHVQGQYSVDEICEAFSLFNQLPVAERPELIVLTRGGGSLEDLHAFNDERVVRAVFGSVVPVVVGVGHERDESLCDFVADVRASTPSNAAEYISSDRHELLRHVQHIEDRMEDRVTSVISQAHVRIERSTLLFERAFIGMGNRLQAAATGLSHAFDRFRLSLVATREYIERRVDANERRYQLTLERAVNRLHGMGRLLESINPERVLARGYAIVRTNSGIVTDPGALSPGDGLSLQFAKSTIQVEVIGKRKQEKLL